MYKNHVPCSEVCLYCRTERGFCYRAVRGHFVARTAGSCVCFKELEPFFGLSQDITAAAASPWTSTFTIGLS